MDTNFEGMLCQPLQRRGVSQKAWLTEDRVHVRGVVPATAPSAPAFSPGWPQSVPWQHTWAVGSVPWTPALSCVPHQGLLCSALQAPAHNWNKALSTGSLQRCICPGAAGCRLCWGSAVCVSPSVPSSSWTGCATVGWPFVKFVSWSLY